MVMLKFKEYITLHLYYFGLYLVMHIALDKDFGNDDLISLPTFMMIFLFPPLMNLYLTRLKVALTKKRKVAEEPVKGISLIENLDQGLPSLIKKEL